MSEYKYSSIAVEQEKAEKLKLLGSIASGDSQLGGLTAKLQQTLKETPEGIKATFSRVVDEASRWLTEAKGYDTGELGMNTAVGTLRQTESRLNDLVARGQGQLVTVIDTFTKKADSMQKELVTRLAQLEAIYSGHEKTIEIWLGHDAAERFGNSLADAKQDLEGQRLRQLNRKLEESGGMIDAAIAEAEGMAEKHQRRVYVLKALRHVCKEMGFEESEPHYENEQDKRSRIVYEVDTLDKGKIRFSISLDKIDAFSGIQRGICLEEFDGLSNQLQKEFGVRTEFKVEGERPDEKLIKKGERDLPEGAYIEKAL
jgi:hypothetical protein